MKYEIIKGSEKDFEGAPDWATVKLAHATGGTVFAESLSAGSKRTGFYSEEPFIITQTIEYSVIAERRPITEPVWDGEGVPCVGQKVMTKSGEGIIDYVGSGVIVYSNNDGQWSVRCDSLDYSLSAIRSPEDVARSNAIGEMELAYEELTGNPAREAEEYYDLIAAGRILGITKTPTVSELMRVTENATREDCEAIVNMMEGKK